MHYKEFIQTFINDSDLSGYLKKVSLFIFRKDGILIYDHLCEKHKMNPVNTSSVGALMSGVWQASQTLFEILPSEGIKDQEFRLGYDTSSSGAYILPMKTVALGEIYLGAIFLDELNPGQVKVRLRNFANDLVENLQTKLPTAKQIQDEEFDKDLFSNITDDEIDLLFKGARV